MDKLVYLLPAIIICGLAWLTGFDFNERRAEAFVIGLFVVMFTGAIAGIRYDI
jgi:type IV secretory pathway VirB2 component (pilin)